jgi:galactan 5-O-arabinofuranosyltransferase
VLLTSIAGAGLELCVSLVAAAGLTWSSQNIRVDPLDRIGQVSGLASIGFRFVLAVLACVTVLHVASRVRGGAAFELTSRGVCAALAGLTTGFIAGGVVVALRGTPFGLNGTIADAGRLARWATAEQRGEPWPFYPPLPVQGLALYSRVFDLPPEYALKHLQIIGTAIVGPIAYASWRPLLSPVWALGIGIVSALPLVEAYKPYTHLTLMVFFPLLVGFLSWLRRSGELDYRTLAIVGGLSGAAFGLIYRAYFGWFQWSAPGAIAAILVLFPWRGGGLARGACLLGSAGAAFAPLAGPLLWQGLKEGFRDDFFYFDTYTNPAYFAMWRWDLPGRVGPWPPPGEFGGVGVFTLLLAAGVGVAIALGRRHVVVITAAYLMAGAWLLRFWYAQRMFETKLVQLFPRTTIEIVYCALVLTAYAVYLALERPLPEAEGARLRDGPQTRPSPLPSTLLGAVCGLALVFGSAASALADRYMPVREKPASLGDLAWVAHLENKR